MPLHEQDAINMCNQSITLFMFQIDLACYVCKETIQGDKSFPCFLTVPETPEI